MVDIIENCDTLQNESFTLGFDSWSFQLILFQTLRNTSKGPGLPTARTRLSQKNDQIK